MTDLGSSMEFQFAGHIYEGCLRFSCKYKFSTASKRQDKSRYPYVEQKLLTTQQLKL